MKDKRRLKCSTVPDGKYRKARYRNIMSLISMNCSLDNSRIATNTIINNTMQNNRNFLYYK